MSIDKNIKKGQIFSFIFIIIGITALITGFVFEFHKEIMTGLIAGFLPTGLGMLLLYRRAENKPELRKNIELENEERNIYINTKAGHTAFWITYWYIFIAIMLHLIINIPILQFLIITLCFMPVVYFSLVILYHKKY